MSLLESFLLAFSLALDCFAISISQGIKNTGNKKAIFTLAILFGIFQAGMLVLGYFIGDLILAYLSNITKFISAGLLFLIGLKMLKESFAEDEEKEENITQIKDYLFLSIATSIDAMAAGVSLVSLKGNLVVDSFIVGLISLIMALIGGLAGNRIGEHFGKRSEIIGALVLISLGIKVLII